MSPPTAPTSRRSPPPAKLSPSDALVFRVVTAWTVYPDSSVARRSAISATGRDIPLAKVGFTMELPAAYSRAEYYGHHPEEHYPDRKTGSFLGRYSRAVQDFFEALRQAAGHGQPRGCLVGRPARRIQIRRSLRRTRRRDVRRRSSPTPPTRLAAAAHPTDQRKPRPHAPRPRPAPCAGLGGASCGPIPITRDIVKAGAARRFGFVIRPLGAQADAAEGSPVSP